MADPVNFFRNLYRNINPFARPGNVFKQITDAAKAEFGTSAPTTIPVNWYREKVKNVGRINRKALFMDVEQQRIQATILPGHMYMFFYDPKHKKTLPYYDQFPLIFPFRRIKNKGFLGINLHYLHPAQRLRLIQALTAVASNRKYNENTRLQINWKVLSNSAKYPEVQPCVKMYLYTQLRSKFIKVNADEWLIASLMPVESFKKRGKKGVWNESLWKQAGG